MPIQQLSTIQLSLVGDGSSTVFTYSFAKLFEASVTDGGQVLSPNTIPTSVILSSVSGLPSGQATLDGFGNLILTFNSSWTGIGIATVQLGFNSGTLAGTSASWTSSTSINTTWTLPLNGAGSVLLPITITGTVTGGALNFQVSADGANWFSIQGTPASSNYQPLSSWQLANGSAVFAFNVLGYSYFRVVLSVAVVGSGSVGFIIQSGTSNPTFVTAGALGIYNSSAPSPSSGDEVPIQLDAYGNLFTNNSRRSQIVSATGNIASVTPATLVAAQGAGVFADLSNLVITLREGVTANIFFGVLISDGTKTYRFNFMSQDVVTFQNAAPLCVNFDPPLPASSSNVAWTIALTSATDTPSVDYIATFVKQKVE